MLPSKYSEKPACFRGKQCGAGFSLGCCDDADDITLALRVNVLEIQSQPRRPMKMTRIVGQLRKQRDRAENEVNRLDAALAALGSLNGSFRGIRPKRRMSAAGRA